jgi:hypothetical protein
LTKPDPALPGEDPSVSHLVRQLDAQREDGSPDFDAQRAAAIELLTAAGPLIRPQRPVVHVVVERE